MTTVQTTTTLGQLLESGPQMQPAVVGGEPAVVLARVGDDQIEVYRSGEIRTYPPDTAAAVLDKPDQQLVVLQEALLLVDTVRRDQAEQHAELLTRIRVYGIERHADGSICLTGLNEFLREFGMPEYSG